MKLGNSLPSSSQANALQIEGLRLDFKEDNIAYLTLTSPLILEERIEVGLDEIEIVIGLDDIYRKTDVEYESTLYNSIEGVLIAKGEWQGENFFNIKVRDKANFKLNLNLRFFDNQLTGFLELVPSLEMFSDFLMGEVKE